MLKTSMMIGERYEVVSKIGAGGMADVYKAMDHKLNRFVAVKVLKQEFREDTIFIKKFKTEAQSAAGLTHPNVVNVFDVGEDQGVHYIVMELVEGITLKDYISKKGKLTVKEATSIAIQVSMGLEAAHSHSIVHRDVKPQNIIISTDGKVKVTDFGIARATSSNTNTISSNAMGSVHYSSPEQVRGGYSDEKSDIYSLGITLYEMVTGKVPFDGETPVAIAIKHLQDAIVPPSEYTPDLPHSLEQIILKCTQKSVDKRYVNMEEVITDLKHSLIEPNGDFVKLYTMDPREKTIVISDGDLDQIKKQRTEGLQSRNQDLFEDEDEDDEEETEGGLSRGLEKAITIGGIIVGALIIIVLIIFIVNATGVLKNFGGGSEEEETEEAQDLVEVPSLIGMTEDEAVEYLQNEVSGIGMRYIGEEASDEYEKGQICYQELEPGTMVERNSTINYKISSGTALVDVPSVIGYEQGEAEELLTELGLNVNVSKAYSSEYEAGTVMTQDPAGGNQAEPGSDVNLEVSMGEQYEGFTVPQVIGMTENAAKTALAPLNVTVQSETSETVEAGVVMAQSLAEGVWVDKGESITITVSTGSADATPTPTTVAATGTWKCMQQLDTPQNYQNGVVKMELVQMVDGSAQASIIVDGKQVEFPYQLDITGVAGITEGTLYLYELIGNEYEELGQYQLTFEQVEE